MAMQDPAGGGRLVVIDASSFADDSVVYTVSDSKTFVGFVQAATAVGGTQNYRVNGIVQILPAASSGGAEFTPLRVTWPAGTVVSKSGSNFFIQGNEL